jgi:hypothetical protein
MNLKKMGAFPPDENFYAPGSGLGKSSQDFTDSTYIIYIYIYIYHESYNTYFETSFYVTYDKV